jgi:hypothetical protein
LSERVSEYCKQRKENERESLFVEKKVEIVLFWNSLLEVLAEESLF